MRVLMAHKKWHVAGGVERHIFDVKEWLEQRGHEVVPFSMQSEENVPSPYTNYFVPPVDMRATGVVDRGRAATRAIFGQATRRQVRRLLDDHQVDVAYVGSVYHQMGSTFLADIRARGIPVVLSLHDYKLGCPNYLFFDDGRRQPCFRCLSGRKAYLVEPIRTGCSGGSRVAGAVLVAEAAITHAARTYQRADVVTVVNELQATAAQMHGIESSKIHRIPHPVLLDDVAVSRAANRTNSPAEEPHVLYVGRLSAEKGAEVLLHAAQQSSWPVRIVGDGRERPALERLAQDLGVDARFMGWVEPRRVHAHMVEAAALVVPSTCPEVWGLVVNEAIAARTPVIASDTGGLSDLLDDERGVLFPVGDVKQLASILQMLRSNPGQFQERASAAWQYARVALSREAWSQRMTDAFAAAGVLV